MGIKVHVKQIELSSDKVTKLLTALQTRSKYTAIRYYANGEKDEVTTHKKKSEAKQATNNYLQDAKFGSTAVLAKEISASRHKPSPIRGW